MGKLKNDLIYLKRAYNLYPKFIERLKTLSQELDIPRDLSWIIELIQYIDRQDRNIEYYLFMTYWELFISELHFIGNDPSK